MDITIEEHIEAIIGQMLHAIAHAVHCTPAQLDSMQEEQGVDLQCYLGTVNLKFYPPIRIGHTQHVLPPWLFIRFKNIERALADHRLQKRRLDPHTGKYNFMGLDSIPAVDECIEELASIFGSSSLTISETQH